MDTNTHITNNKSTRIAILVIIVFMSFLAFRGLFGESYKRGAEAIPSTIVVSGSADVFASPDVAVITFDVSKESKVVADAQAQVNKIITDVKNSLQAKGIADKDIKTQYYNTNPVYDYTQSPVKCTEFACPPSQNQVLRGYQVMQNIEVKIRKIDASGDVLTLLGSKGVTNISGVSFSIDDPEAKKAEARKQAIDSAKQKAEVLANQLGVRIVRVVNFNEDGSPMYPMYRMGAMDMKSEVAAPVAVTLPMGENKITSNVTITYEIR